MNLINITDETEKQYVSFLLKPITPNQMRQDLMIFWNKDMPHTSMAGLKVIQYYFFREMLETKTRYGSFWDICIEWNLHLTKPYIRRFYEYVITEKGHNENFTIYHTVYEVARLYFHYTIHTMKPCFVLSILNKYKPIRVLDPCAGWGARLMACMRYGCGYIGFDTNTRLMDCYEALKKECDANYIDANVFNEDCITGMPRYADTYDMVFTSPPYWNLEVYPNMIEKSPSEWREWYAKVFSIAFEGLRDGGHMCINIKSDVYDKVLSQIFGPSDYRVSYPKSGNRKREEFLYVWKKK